MPGYSCNEVVTYGADNDFHRRSKADTLIQIYWVFVRFYYCIL